MFRNAGPVGDTMPALFRSLSPSTCGEFSDAWPLMQNPICGDNISFCDSYPELTGEDIRSLGPEDGSSSSLDSNRGQGSVGGAFSIQAPSENFTETAELSRRSSSLTEPALAQETRAVRSRPDQTSGRGVNLTAQTCPQVRRCLAAECT